MSLVKRPGSKNWYAQFMINGRTYVRSTKTASKALAAKIEQKFKDETVESLLLDDGHQTTIREAIERLVQSKDNERARRRVRSEVTFLTDYNLLELDADLDTIDSKTILMVYDYRKRLGHAKETIKKTFTFFRQLLDHHEQRGYRVQRVTYPTVGRSKGRLRYLSEHEEKKLLDELVPTHNLHREKQQDNYDFVVLLLDTGARHGEISHLKWSDVDLDNGKLHLYRPKVCAETILDLPDRSLQILKRRHNERQTQWVFTNSKGGPRNHAPIAINKAIKRAGLQDVTFHTFRHTFASRMAQNGMSLQEIALLLGHTTTQMSERYAHLIPNPVTTKAKEILDKLNPVEGLRAV